MQEMPPTNRPDCKDSAPYSYTQEILANLPFAAMLFLGAAILAAAIEHNPERVLAPVFYISYGMAGVLWIMAFLCPYCHFHGTRLCPCGYGQFAARLAQKKDGSRFSEKFKKHIPVIVPLWIIPPIVGTMALFDGFHWLLFTLLLLFILNSFVVLPLLSKKHCCSACPQKDVCPWMS